MGKPEFYNSELFNDPARWENGFVLSSRDAYHIIEQSQYYWCVECAASVGDSAGLGSVDWNAAITTNVDGTPITIADGTTILGSNNPAEQHPFMRSEPPIVPGLASDKANLEFETAQDTALGIAGLITLGAANSVMVQTYRELWRRFQAKMVISRGLGSWRGRAHFLRCAARMQVHEKAAFARLCAACKPKHKRKGLQTISTRKTGIPAQGVFQFNGRWAYAYRRGRPAYSETEWLARERVRNKKRRKNPMRTRRDKRKLHPRETKWPRPTFRVNAAKKTSSGIYHSYSPPDVEKLLEWREQSEICALDNPLSLIGLA